MLQARLNLILAILAFIDNQYYSSSMVEFSRLAGLRRHPIDLAFEFANSSLPASCCSRVRGVAHFSKRQRDQTREGLQRSKIA